MSLENSEFTYFSLLARERQDKECLKRVLGMPPLSKRPRTQDSGIHSQSISPNENQFISGTVIEVILENFLCHSHLHVRLDKEVTIIKGNNGSGKSAILTAVIVAFGGRASTTGRGVSLQDFIKRNETYAKIVCVVNNNGYPSFKSNKFGQKIIIERILRSDGGSSVKIKSDKGKVISTKMEDLRTLALKLDIQVDNPVSVLDQTTAKTFLNDSDPTKKFIFFMRATNLDKIESIHSETEGHMRTVKKELNKKERELLLNKAELEESKRKIEILESFEKDRDEELRLKLELLWAEVRECILDMEMTNGNLMKIREEKLNLEASTNEHSERLLLKIESNKAEIQAQENQRTDLDCKLKELKTSSSNVNREHKKLIYNKHELEKKIECDKRTIQDFKTEIHAQEKQMLPGNIEEKQKQREQIENLQFQLDKGKTDRNVKEGKMSELMSNALKIRDAVDEMKISKKCYEDELKKWAMKLHGLEAATSDFSVFGPCMPELIKQIENTEFRKKPIGPLGAYVKVHNPKWAFAVENATRAHLHTFVVDNLDDEVLLKRLIKVICTRGKKPAILRTSFQTAPYDTEGRAARTPQFGNILDIVEISNAVAFNALVDCLSLESVLLIPTDSECFASLSNVQSVPRNCKRAFTLKGDRYEVAPNFATYHAHGHSPTILETSRSSVIRETTGKINELNRGLDRVNLKLEQLISDQKNTSEQIEECRIEIRNIHTQSVEMDKDLEKLRDLERNDTKSLSDLRHELNERDKQLTTDLDVLKEFPAREEIIVQEKQRLKESESEINNKLKEINCHIENLQRKQKSFKEKSVEIECAQTGKQHKLLEVKKQEERILEKYKDLDKKHREKKARAEKFETHLQCVAATENKDFESMCNTERSVRTVDLELHTISRRLASVEKALGQNYDLIGREFSEKLKAYEATEIAIKALKENANLMWDSLEQRKCLYMMQKKVACAITSHQFTRVLQKRNYSGKIEIDFNNKELKIVAGPIDGGERSSTGTLTLSGGERSYVTTALIVSLFISTEMPFYYFDEFDVCMDKDTRQTALSILLDSAKQRKGHQFIFLTPLDTPGLRESERVSIVRLEDPKRS